MKPLSVGEIAKAVKNSNLEQWHNQTPIVNITTDSRLSQNGVEECFSKENSLFVALKGENFDAHKFVDTVLQNKVSYALVDHGDESNPELIFCKNTEQGFLDIAGFYRDRYCTKMVGITGSVGKTTTKEMIAQVLSASFKTLKTEGNLNNRVGLPKTLLNLDETMEAAVIEMGMNSFGEISDLTRCAKPDMAVITNIGLSHIEFLGSQEGILKAKLEILEGMKPGSPLILNGDDPLLKTVSPKDHHVILYGIENKDCAVTAEDIVEKDGTTYFVICSRGKRNPVMLPAFGIHNVLNALAAFTVGQEFGMIPEDITKALENYHPVGMRQKVVEHNQIRVVEDCYNAGPDSMHAALIAFGNMPCKNNGRRIFIMGDMLELGEQSKNLHYEMGICSAKQPIELLYYFGEECSAAANGAREIREATGAADNIFYFTDKNLLVKHLISQINMNDTIWIKGSRGMKLEEVIEKIYEKL